MTADHKVLSEGCESRNNHRHAVVVQDLATQGIQSYPCKRKTSQETQRCLRKFLGPKRKPKVIYTDNFLEPRAKVERGSGKHGVYTHFTKHPNGDICLKTKITTNSCRRRAGTVVPGAQNSGDLITADHKILSEGSESRNNRRYAVVVQNLATQWEQSNPSKTKTSQETQKNLMKFLEPTRKPEVIYIDNSLKFGKLCEELSWNHSTSTPHRSETNGIAERAVRRVKEGTSAVLLRSSLDNGLWADSMECHCYLRNIQDLLSDRKTPYERRFGMPSNGPVIPFGAMVDYHPTSAKDTSGLHQVGPRVLPGCFLGYVMFAGRICKGDITIADIEELAQMDTSELHA